MSVISDVKLPDIEMPDVSKIDLPKVDVDKARERMTKSTSNVRNAVAGMRRRDTSSEIAEKAPAAIVIVIGGILAGIGIGYILGTSAWFTGAVRGIVDQARARMNGTASGGYDDLGDSVEIEYAAVATDMTGALSDTDTAPGAGYGQSPEPVGVGEQMSGQSAFDGTDSMTPDETGDVPAGRDEGGYSV